MTGNPPRIRDAEAVAIAQLARPCVSTYAGPVRVEGASGHYADVWVMPVDPVLGRRVIAGLERIGSAEEGTRL